MRHHCFLVLNLQKTRGQGYYFFFPFLEAQSRCFSQHQGEELLWVHGEEEEGRGEGGEGVGVILGQNSRREQEQSLAELSGWVQEALGHLSS